jgi:predicted esterase
MATTLVLTLAVSAATGEELRQVHFNAYSPLAANSEIVRRLMSPVDADRIQSYLQSSGKTLPEQTIELEKERFSIYVPNAPAPDAGYGLLVFISPFEQALVPPEWRSILNQQGMIYVAAEHSGNLNDMIGRRIPLALHAYENISRRYRLDPTRVFVGGFSGGARTAMRIALSYPDIFRGALLNSGNDPFGTAGISLPRKELFDLVQTRSRFVFITGDRDSMVLATDVSTRHSAERLCVQGLETLPMDGGHQLLGTRELRDGLRALQEAKPLDTARLESCRSEVRNEMETGLAEVEALLAQGQIKQAGERLSHLDDHLGGLAAPHSVELARKILAGGAR